MAIGNFHWITKGLLATLDGTIDLNTDAFTAHLVDETWTPAQNTDDLWSSISAKECADGDYSALALSGLTLTQSGGVIYWDFADLDFGNTVTISAKYLIIKHNTSGKIVGFVDLNTASTSALASSTAANFDIGINASGAFSVTPGAYSAGS
ncbi:MAG: hypothetical protein CMF31_05125 [Kordiimonas sp.]|nr:hypothetical protein [Kordiimonas sp.]|tara:strand:+ start:75 stop:527 length:453 start_codon:yes stop_codon:yes gene_type:complete